jgi:hypothetical protein
MIVDCYRLSAIIGPLIIFSKDKLNYENRLLGL